MKIHLLTVLAFALFLSLPVAAARAHITSAPHVHATPVAAEAPKAEIPADEDAAAASEEDAEGEGEAHEDGLPAIQGAPGIGDADSDTMGEGE